MRGLRTMANAIPTNAPMLRTTGFQSAPRLFRACAAVVGRVCSCERSSSFALKACIPPVCFDVQTRSTQGNRFPRIKPAAAQNPRYVQVPRSIFFISTGAMPFVPWSCVTMLPYANPMRHNAALLRSSLNTCFVVLTRCFAPLTLKLRDLACFLPTIFPFSCNAPVFACTASTVTCACRSSVPTLRIGVCAPVPQGVLRLSSRFVS